MTGDLPDPGLILLTGATGYVGGRLLQVGLLGRLYWYALYPLHQLVFGGMLRRIVAATLREIDTAC